MNDSVSTSFTNSVTENIKCFVRCRPLNEKENELGVGCININEESKTIFIDNKSETKAFENKSFTLDHVFPGDVIQQEIFERLAIPILKGFFQGFNCTIFAYGQTGAGKTHTMLGPLESVFLVNSEFHGLIPRILHFIFDIIENNLEKAKFILNETSDIKNIESEVSCSCLEIYQEQIIDLLATLTTSSFEDGKLVIREDVKRGMFIEGLTESIVKNDKSAMAMLMLGLKNRHVAATAMNAESSRSHLIFTIFLNFSYTRTDGSIISRSSRLHMIDLAGSERQKATKAQGERIKEAGMINKSLSTLGNVINALVWLGEGKSRYVPFRDSKLTFFLKDSLGGNAKTTIIANISQSIINLPETISTLKFVQRAKMIKNKAFINEKVNDKLKLLQEEVKRLKDELSLFSTAKINLDSTTGLNNFICSLCKNKEGNNSENKNTSLPTTIPDIANSSGNLEIISNKINELMEKIHNLLIYEDELSDKFKLIDSMTATTIEKFFVSKQIYENDSKMFLDTLEKKIKQFNNVLKFKDNLLNEVKEEISKLKKGNSKNHDENFLEKIESFTNELTEFRQDFEINKILSLTKLNEENKMLKTELEAMKHLKEYFINLNKCSENQKKFFDKLNVDRMENIAKEFIQSNEELKSFFEDNFAKIDSDEEIDKFIIISKNELERVKFQLEEMKINEENNLKLIDELNSENFLMDMELAKYREKEKESGKDIELENEREKIRKYSEKEVVSNIPIITELNPKITEFNNHGVDLTINHLSNNFNIGYNDYPASTPTKNNHGLNLILERKNSNTNSNSNSEEKQKNISNKPSISVIDEGNEKTEDADNPQTSNILIPNLMSLYSGSNFNSNSKIPINRNKNDFINNLRKSFAHSSPISKVIRSSLLYTARTPRLNIHEEFLNHPHNHLNNHHASEIRFSGEIKNIPIENFEFIKLKQKLDDALINLEEKNEEILDKNEEIEELKLKLEELNNEKERMQIILNQQNEEIETITESNRFMQIDLISLNKKFNHLKKQNEEFISSMGEISLIVERNNLCIEDLSEKYSKITEEFLNLLEDKIKKIPVRFSTWLKKIMDNYMNSNLSPQIDYVHKEVNNSIIINEIKIEKIKEQFKNFVENSTNYEFNLIHKIQSIEEENFNLKKKFEQIKTYLGDEDFDFDFMNMNNKPFTIKLDKSKFNKLEKRLLELKEEKNQLKADIALLKIDFNKSLSDKALDSKIQLLMKIKEENHNLKLELIEIKKKNETLEKTILNLQDSMNKLLPSNMDETNYLTNAQSITNFSSTHQNQNINFENFIKIRREHKELIDFIFEIGNELKIREIIPHINQTEKKIKFHNAMDILKSTQEILTGQLQKNNQNNPCNTFDPNLKPKFDKQSAKKNISTNELNTNFAENLIMQNKIKHDRISDLSPKNTNSNKIISRNKNDFSLTPTKTISSNKEFIGKKNNPVIDKKEYMSSNKSVSKKLNVSKNVKISNFKNSDDNTAMNTTIINRNNYATNSQLSHTPVKTRSSNAVVTNTNVNVNNPNVKTIKIDIKSNVKSAARSNSNTNVNK